MHDISSLDQESIVSYPSPFFDLSNNKMPDDMDELLDWCIYYYLATPLIPAVINKLSTYPITEAIINCREAENKNRWEKLVKQTLHIRYKMYENNLDYFLMGAAYSSIYISFTRQLICKKCKTSVAMNGADWRISFKKRRKSAENNMPEFSLDCKICQGIHPADIKDRVLRDWRRVNVVRYSPRDIKPIRDPISGRSKYLWTIPAKYAELIKSGRHPDLIERCPAEILEAINSDRKVLLSDNNVYEMARPCVSGTNMDRGIPIVIHALKWTYYLSQLLSAQEAIAHEKIVPFDIFFPAAAGNSSTAPSQSLSFGNFTAKLKDGLAKKRKDPNHKIIMPSAVGNVRLGGDGRALMLAAEIDWVSKQIISSMNVPLEFVYGGLTWTGSSISLRMMENLMIGIRDSSEDWLQWVVEKIAAAFNVRAPEIRLADLKMADDVQKQSLFFQMEAAEKISTGTLLDEFGIDFNKESDKILGEAEIKARLIINSAITSAKAQGTAAMVQNDFMMRSQLIQQNQSSVMQVDPNTGYPIDPGSGAPVDPNTGFPIDPQTGLPMDPNTGQYINPETGEAMTPDEVQEHAQQTYAQQAQEQQAQPVESQGDQGVPGSTVDNAVYSQEEQKQGAQEAAAVQAANYNNAPPNLKITVTNLAKQLISSDLFTRQSVLQNISSKSPALAKMVQERMGMLMGATGPYHQMGL